MFGDLLSQGLRSIAARENKALLALEDELGYKFGITRWAIERWRRGAVPDPERVEALARTCMQRGAMDRTWLIHFLKQAHHYDWQALVEELCPGTIPLPEAPILRHNLPRRLHEHLVGREQELADLHRYLSADHRLGVVCLSGLAGVGKSALALECAHRYLEGDTLPVGERFTAIVWMTAKQAELLPAGLTPRRPTFRDLDGLYRALAEVLDLPAITRVVGRAEQEVIVARTLAERRVLLIVDNLEDIDDPTLLVFLRELPSPSKAIVTTRHRIDVAVPIHLQALQASAARDLIDNECRRHTLRLAEEQAERLLRRTGGLPLAIVRTIGRMAWRGSHIEAELRQLGDPTNDLYAFCYEHSIALIRSGDAHRLFMALALFATDSSRHALGYVAGFENDILGRDEGLSELEVLSLITRNDDRFSLDPLTRIRARDELDTTPDFEQATRERWLAWYQHIAEKLEEPAHFSAFQTEADTLLKVIKWLITTGQMDNAAKLFCQVRLFLFGIGYWVPLSDIAERVVDWAEVQEEVGAFIAAMRSLLRIAREREDLSRMEALLERMQRFALPVKSEMLEAELWLTQARVARIRGDWPFERLVGTIQQALDLFQQYSRWRRVLTCFNILGNLYLKEKRFADAALCYRTGLDMLAKQREQVRGAREWQAILQGNLGIGIGHQGNYAEACEILYDVLRHLTDQTDYAEVYVILATYEWYLGHIEQAYKLRNHAEQIIERLALPRPICDEDAAWLQLQESIG
ncbi:MAG: AAA family ATPase [Ardenticatenales bacterium]|nr:AAA family ATPase [Ardenticatenales bacterium]